MTLCVVINNTVSPLFLFFYFSFICLYKGISNAARLNCWVDNSVEVLVKVVLEVLVKVFLVSLFTAFYFVYCIGISIISLLNTCIVNSSKSHYILTKQVMDKS